MKFYDISLDLSPKTVTWPGEKPMRHEERRGTAITSRFDMPSHFGTHIDAPKHFIFNMSGIDKIPLSKLVGPCKVFGIKPQNGNLIQVSDIKRLQIKKHDKILFKTSNSKLLAKKKFNSNYISLSLKAAEYLASKSIDLVANDYFGIEAKSTPDHPVHKALLKKHVVIVEAVDLSKVKPGNYNVAALPLKIKSGDGSPARVVLWN